MCLDTMDLKPKKHKIGYKICRKGDNCFTGNIFDTGPYYIGKTYNALMDQDELPLINGGNGVKYLAGFHYYLRRKDAVKQCGLRNAVIRILVEGVIATGTQNECDAGVAEIMTLDRVSFDGSEEELRLAKNAHKKFLKICSGETQQKILKFAKKFGLKTFLPKTNDMKKVADFMSKTKERYVDFVVFVDAFPRQSMTFKILTKFHIWALENHDEYKNLYYYVTKVVHECDPDELQNDDVVLRKKLMRPADYELMMKEAEDIDDFVLNNV